MKVKVYNKHQIASSLYYGLSLSEEPSSRKFGFRMYFYTEFECFLGGFYYVFHVPSGESFPRVSINVAWTCLRIGFFFLKGEKLSRTSIKLDFALAASDLSFLILIRSSILSTCFCKLSLILVYILWWESSTAESISFTFLMSICPWL